ncbi:hypothetical protein WJX79_010035 [Trebouxia sp. C0005]
MGLYRSSQTSTGRCCVEKDMLTVHASKGTNYLDQLGGLVQAWIAQPPAAMDACASTAGLVTDPQTTLLLPNYRRLCKQAATPSG